MAKIDIPVAGYCKFFPKFETPIRYLKSAYQTASEKNAGSETSGQKLKKRSPYYTPAKFKIAIYLFLALLWHYIAKSYDVIVYLQFWGV